MTSVHLHYYYLINGFVMAEIVMRSIMHNSSDDSTRHTTVLHNI